MFTVKTVATWLSSTGPFHPIWESVETQLQMLWTYQNLILHGKKKSCPDSQAQWGFQAMTGSPVRRRTGNDPVVYSTTSVPSRADNWHAQQSEARSSRSATLLL